MSINLRPAGYDGFLGRLIGLYVENKKLFDNPEGPKPQLSVDIGTERFSQTPTDDEIKNLFNGVDFNKLATTKDGSIMGDNTKTQVLRTLFENLLDLFHLYSLRNFLTNITEQATNRLKPILEVFNTKAREAGKEEFAQFQL